MATENLKAEKPRRLRAERKVKTPDGGGREQVTVFSKAYWREAAANYSKVKLLIFAALVCALRIAVKGFRITILPNTLYLSFDPYINAVGSLVYGPLVALGVGAISDTIGAIIFPSGPYFFPFIVVEMSSSFIFALFFWKKRLTPWSVILAKFTVNLVSNLILNSLIIKWSYSYFATGGTYSFLNGARIVKNLALYPLEGTLIVIVLNAFLPVLRRAGFTDKAQQSLHFRKRDICLIAGLAILSVAIVLLYHFVLKDFIKEHNFKWW